jgi:hypothetical protein
MFRARSTAWRVALGASATLGCSSLDRFDTKGTAAYCGSLVAVPAFEAGLLPKSSRPRSLNATLKLDIGALTQRGDQSAVVGSLTTDDADRGLCATQQAALFDAAPLRTMPALDSDALSTLEFGSGHDYNFFAWVDSSCQGTMLSVVSLMRNDSVELRLLKPAAMPAPEAGPEQQPGFGLFYLERRNSGCEY